MSIVPFYGWLDCSFWQYVAIALALTHITIVSVTIYLHRYSAHRALELHPIASHFFRFWLWLTTGMLTKEWTAIHRKHHAKCETEEDPHSPQRVGLATVLWQGTELYRKEGKNPDTLERFGKGTPEDAAEAFYVKYTSWGIRLMLLLNIVLFGVPGFIIWAVQMGWIPFFAAGIVNGVGHFWGYRNFECDDAATNVSPIGLLIGGEELHNNHHSYPTSAKMSVKWWEFDVGWLYISLLKSVGLAKVKRSIPKATVVPGKSALDSDTLTALLTNRFHVMASYTKAVLLPILKEQEQLASPPEVSLLKRVRKVMIRQPALVEPLQRLQLEAILATNPTLELVMRFKQKLQAIWDHTTANQKELIEALSNWCKEAEASSVQALQDFSAYIKGYSLKNQVV